MSQMQKYPLVPVYHLLWTSSEDVACQYSATQLFSLRGLQHTTPYIAKLAWLPDVHLAGIGDVVRVVLALAGQTNSVTTLDLFLPTSGHRSSYGATVERRDGSSWLRDDDDDGVLIFP